MRRAFLVVLLLAAVVGVPLGVHAYTVLCAGPVDGYELLAAPRNQAQRALRSAHPEPIATAAPAVLRVSALDVLLDVKEADPVAFPAHVVVGLILQAGGCPVAATGDQWRKAAAHAWFTGAAQVAAWGLDGTIGKAEGSQAVLSLLQQYAQDQPVHDADLLRVQQAYTALCAGDGRCAQS